MLTCLTDPSRLVPRLLAMCLWSLLVLFSMTADGHGSGLHFQAFLLSYFLVAFATRVIFRNVLSRQQIAAFLLASMMLRVLKVVVFGEAFALGLFAASAAGAAAGILVARALVHSYRAHSGSW